MSASRKTSRVAAYRSDAVSLDPVFAALRKRVPKEQQAQA